MVLLKTQIKTKTSYQNLGNLHQNSGANLGARIYILSVFEIKGTLQEMCLIEEA